MEIEQIEILQFLQRHSPFQELPPEQQLQLAQSINVGYFQAGSEILRFNEPLQALHLIRSGAVETFRRNGDLYNRLSEGGIFGEQGLLRGHLASQRPRAVRPTRRAVARNVAGGARDSGGGRDRGLNDGVGRGTGEAAGLVQKGPDLREGNLHVGEA